MTLALDLKVRQANKADLPQLLVWAAKFHQMSPYKDMPFDQHATCRFMEQLIDEPNAAIFVHEEGMLAAVLKEVFFSPDQVVAQELFWYADHGGRLLADAFEVWALIRGATAIAMASIGDNPRLDQIYRERGLEPAEQFYMRAL
jgi:hypothetical protein